MITAADIVRPGKPYHPFNTKLGVAQQWHQIMTTDPAMAKGLIGICIVLVLVALFITFRRRGGSQG